LFSAEKRKNEMKKLITALTALVATASVAMAADLPSRKAPVAPVSTNAFTLSGWYAGGFVGGNVANWDNVSWDKTPAVFGALVGYEWNPYFRTEATFDYTTKAAPTTSEAGQTVFANAVVQYPIGFGFTPYAFAGTGFGWNAWGKGVSGANFVDDAKLLYNVGGGVRYAVTERIDIDGRYRYINAYSGTKFDNNHVVTLGANYKF
jgi:opacity protein-like surface antigen